AQASGEVRSDLAAADLAGFVVSALEGAIMLSRLNKREEPLARVLKTLRSMLDLTVAESPAIIRHSPSARRCAVGEEG
ncbi:hypothetical protein KQH41_02460, partial [bacterium]|nr:hypothetical protein [bacterium]